MGPLGAIFDVSPPDRFLPKGPPALQSIFAVCHRGFTDLRQIHHVGQPTHTQVLSEFHGSLKRKLDSYSYST